MSFYLRKNFGDCLRIHFYTFSSITLEKQVILFILNSMSTKVKNLDRLFHPVMKLVHCCPLPDVLNLALNFFENPLNNVLLLKIIDLARYFSPMYIEHRLTVQKQEWSRNRFMVWFFSLVPFNILHEHLAKRITVYP